MTYIILYVLGLVINGIITGFLDLDIETEDLIFVSLLWPLTWVLAIIYFLLFYIPNRIGEFLANK